METTIKIEGMSCCHCTSAVKNALAETDGVVSVEVSLEEKCAKVVFDENKVSVENLKEVVEDQGFDVVD